MTNSTPYPIIDGQERKHGSLGTIALVNPSTEEVIANIPSCGAEEALEAARLSVEGFAQWSAISAFDRGKILRRAADQMRAEVEEAAAEMTRESGKPLVQARGEWMASADLLDWFAEEGRRAYGRLIPTRASDMRWAVHRRPVGPVAAFTPWNFPAWNVMQKVAPALAAGCSVVLKCAEETPSSGYRIARALLDAGLPPRALSVIWGDAPAISAALCAAPEIHKVTLTGSTRVGRILASAAGQHLKKVTMELGGHNPVIIARDVDLNTVVPLAAEFKFRNAGQVCVSDPLYRRKAALRRFRRRRHGSREQAARRGRHGCRDANGAARHRRAAIEDRGARRRRRSARRKIGNGRIADRQSRLFLPAHGAVRHDT